MTIQELAEKEFPIKSWEERQAGAWCRQLYCMGAEAVFGIIDTNLRSKEFEEKIREIVEIYIVCYGDRFKISDNNIEELREHIKDIITIVEKGIKR